MPWKLSSDTTAFDPRVLDVREHPKADYRSVNDLAGFYDRMTTQLAQYPRDDFTLSYAECLQLASGVEDYLELLWDQATFCKLGRVVKRNRRRAFQIFPDPSFVSVKTKKQVDFERQRRADNANLAITLPTRLRDGDVCRYCDQVVDFRNRTGHNGGTYDHRPPGVPAVPGASPTSVVCCQTCNKIRGGIVKGIDDPDRALAMADAVKPLHAVPRRRFYQDQTLTWFNQPQSLAIFAQYGLTPPPPAEDLGGQPATVTVPAPGAAATPPGAGAVPATSDAPVAGAAVPAAATPSSAGAARNGDAPAAPFLLAPAGPQPPDLGERGSQQAPAETRYATSRGEGRAGQGVGSGSARLGSGGLGWAEEAAAGPPPRSRRRGRRGGRR